MFAVNLLTVCLFLGVFGKSVSGREFGYKKGIDDEISRIKREPNVFTNPFLNPTNQHAGVEVEVHNVVRTPRKAFIKLPVISLPKIPSPKDVIRHIGGHLGFNNCHHDHKHPENRPEQPNHSGGFPNWHPQENGGYHNRPPPHGGHPYPGMDPHHKPHHWMGHPMNFPPPPQNPNDIPHPHGEFPPDKFPTNNIPEPDVIGEPIEPDHPKRPEENLGYTQPDFTPNTQHVTPKPELVGDWADPDVWINKSEEEINPTTPLIDIRFGNN